jgi:KDO2-lipid IV(A) lauroyltransferase
MERLLYKHHPEAPRVSVSDVFAAFGSMLGESLCMNQSLNSLSFSAEGLEEAQALLGQQRGLVALCAHYGNWELLSAYIASQGFPLAVVGREAQFNWLQQGLSKLRSHEKVRVLWRGQVGARKEMIRTLERGEILAALIDQDTRVDSVFSPFLGVEAKTPSSLIALALRRNVPIVSVFMRRISTTQFHIVVQSMRDTSSIEIVAQEFNTRLAAEIIRDPAEWVWFHKRWRSRPNGTVYGSSQYLALLNTDGLPTATAPKDAPVVGAHQV